MIIFLGANAQEGDLKITKSEVFKSEKYKTSLLFAKEDSNGDIFLVRNFYKTNSSPLGYYIEHYNKDLTLLKRDEIEVNRSELRGLYIIDSKIILLQFKYLQKEKKYAFVALTSSKEEFNFVEKYAFSIDRDKIKKYDHYGIRKEPEFTLHKEYKFGEVVESENKDFIAINLFVKNEDNDSFFVVVFDKNFNKLYEYNLSKINTESNSKSSLFAYQNMKLDNQGNVYLLGKVYKNKSGKEKVKGIPNYTFELFKINKQGQKQILIDDSKYFIDELQIFLKNDILSCIGFYSNKKSNNSANENYSKDGIIRININVVNDEVFLKSYQPFKESINNLTFEKIASFGSVNDNLFVKNSYIDDDIIIYSEKFSIYISDNSIQSRNSYGDILVFKISPNGELIWAKSINKHQKAWNINNIPYLSYSRLNFNKSSYLFINAEEEVKLDKNNDFKFSYSKSKNVPFMIFINEKGEIDYTNLNNEGLKDISLEVRFGVLLNDNSLLMEAESNGKPLLVKISQ